ncbi:MAG: carbamoyltransferase HypF, partial [Anaerolineales bacterium]|nr:carbamoyltransferase HypF [Anaerolineales bacterium]
QTARQLLQEGRVLAVKGLGGFHLACDATNPEAVATLRRRKLRVDKPFALMMPDLATVETHCYLQPTERSALESHQRPVVILDRRPESSIVREVAPGQDTMGVMLPYTPLHVLLIEPEPGFPQALVMTSGNLSEEPIAIENEEARKRLSEMADAFLMHDRCIHTRCDDAVIRIYDGAVYPLRRSRGYAPYPVHLPWENPPLLAVGAELKNTFCITRGRYAFLSHHIGDLENYETLCSFEEGIAHFERLFRMRPEILAYDLHPDYLATRYALERAERENLTAIGVQHHHAHVAACMAEHGLDGEQPVIGVSFDGTGYGDDGTIWGGEFLVANYRDYERPLHLAYIPMAGGEAAVRQPWRLALAWLERADLEWDENLPPVLASSAKVRHIVRR